VAFNAGWAFGPATAGLLAKKSFLWLFVGDAFSSILFGLVAWFALPAGVRGTRAGNALSDTIAVVRTDGRFRQLLLGSLLVWLVFVQLFSTMSLEVTRNGFSSSTYGLLISLNGLLVVLFELPLTSVTKRFPRRQVLALGYVLIGLGFASNVFPRTLLLLLLTSVLFTFGEMISMPLAGAYVADLAPPDQRGLYMGAYGLVGASAFIFGPSLGLWVFSASPFMLWASCGVLGLMAAAAILREPRAGMARERVEMRSPSI
jgi:MFS family permease